MPGLRGHRVPFSYSANSDGSQDLPAILQYSSTQWSAMSQKQTLNPAIAMSALPPKTAAVPLRIMSVKCH
jgi:hypothetical protein